MKDVTITLHCEVTDEAIPALKKAVEHHIEQLVDVDNWSKEIYNFYDCKLEVNVNE